VLGYLDRPNVKKCHGTPKATGAVVRRDGAFVLEALGFKAIARQQYGEAAQDYERAIAIRPQSRTLLDQIQAPQ
jgi:hypothetical protein